MSVPSTSVMEKDALGVPTIEAKTLGLIDRVENLVAVHCRRSGSDEIDSSNVIVARAPGRVNLIGEHIDYMGYAVLPMAIALDTLVAIGSVDKGSKSDDSDQQDKLLIGNVESNDFNEISTPADPSLTVQRNEHRWAGYVLCAYKGIYEHREEANNWEDGMWKDGTGNGLVITVEGRVPRGSGLSSSSALVCASSIAIAAKMGLKYEQAQIAEIARQCEQYIGTLSGGMDQAISLLGEAGKAKLIEFNPIVAFDVPLPGTVSFVVANSLTESNKADTASKHYNLRVVECRLAAILLGKALEMKDDELLKIKTLKEIEIKFFNDLEKATEFVKASLKNTTYEKGDIEDILNMPLEKIFHDSPAALQVLEKINCFNLSDRALHVYSEAKRVLDFRGICTDNADRCASNPQNTQTYGQEAAQRLGDLMNASHGSCRDLYGCSCPELEELTKVMRDSGAIGARLTGAGWGGCAVAVIESGQEDAFISKVTSGFFRSRIENGMIKEEDMDSYIFASRPSPGAAVIAT